MPFLVLLALMAVAAARRQTPVAPSALAALAFGTMLLPFSVTLYGHLLAAALGFGAWLILDGEDRPAGRAWLVGAIVGLAVLVEYQMAIVAVVLAVVLVLRRSWRHLVRYVAAGVPFVVVMAGYQSLAYGSPLRSGYDEKPRHHEASFLITGLPKPTTTWSFLMGSRGMLLFTPIVAIALIGLVVRWRRRHEEGVGVALAVCTGFLLLQAGWVNPWGGETPGPRYVIPMLPFLVLGVAELWPSVPLGLRRFVVALSVTSMVLPTLTEHLMGDHAILIIDHLGRLLTIGPEPTLFTMAVGPLGWVPHLLIVAAVGWHIRPLVLGSSSRVTTLGVADGDGNEGSGESLDAGGKPPATSKDPALGSAHAGALASRTQHPNRQAHS